MNRNAACLTIAALVFPLAALAAPADVPRKDPPASSRTFANVYLLAQAGAILDICLARPTREAIAPDRVKELEGLSARLAGLVEFMAAHERDKGLNKIYESTKATMAGDAKLQAHTRETHQNCGDRFTGDMMTYVAENEAAMKSYLANPPTSKR